MRFGLGFAVLGSVMASAASADSSVDIDRAVYVERAAEGVRALEPATALRRGDKVVLVVAWQGGARGRHFTVQSAVPRTLAFQRAGSDAAEVSIDGGRTWGTLGALRIGNRLASPEDVTHVRQRTTGRADGRMTFSAIVR